MPETRRGASIGAPGLEAATELDGAEPGHPAAPSGSRVFLLVRRGADFDLTSVGEGDSVLIGRSSKAQLVVDDPRMSRVHARLDNRGGEIVVRDLGSRNGTRINGTVLTSAERVLVRGDVVVAGPLELVLVAAPTPDVGRPAADGARRPDAAQRAEPIAVDPSMVALYETVRRLARVPMNVLITGETGTGKEIVAARLHALGPGVDRPLVCVNCASMPESLLESELFGHEKGAFTGAHQRKIGHIEAAHGGTLLLDEIGDMPLGMQPKLLRVLESRRLARLGGREEIDVDVRVVSATHRDLAREVASGRFREDLFYRIAAFSLRVPPLRERPSEIVPLARHFAAEFAARARLQPSDLGPDAQAALRAHQWPGNVRELKNAVEHAMVLCSGETLRAEHLPATVTAKDGARASDRSDGAAPIRERVADVERNGIVEALAASNGNQRRAAERLGISRRALLYKLAKYGIKR